MAKQILNEEFKRMQKLAGLINENELNVPGSRNLTGDVDFRYESTLRLSFDEPAYGDLDTDEGEEEKDYIDYKLLELLEDVSNGEEIELDWRGDDEIEIHNIDQNKFYEKYDDNFISLI
jgi:hypothetical protein